MPSSDASSSPPITLQSLVAAAKALPAVRTYMRLCIAPWFDEANLTSTVGTAAALGAVFACSAAALAFEGTGNWRGFMQWVSRGALFGATLPISAPPLALYFAFFARPR